MEITALIVAIVSALAAIGAMIIAIRGNKIAREGNEIAQQAQESAVEANQLAADANQISADANNVARRALAVSEDQLIYEWRVWFDKDLGVVCVENHSAFVARDVTVLIRYKDVTVVDARFDEIAAFAQVSVSSGEIVEGLRKEEVDHRRAWDSGLMVISSPYISVMVYISWITEGGVSRNTVIEQRLQY